MPVIRLELVVLVLMLVLKVVLVVVLVIVLMLVIGDSHCENDIIAIKLNDCFINDSGCALIVDFIIDEYAKSGNVYGIGFRTNVHDSK